LDLEQLNQKKARLVFLTFASCYFLSTLLRAITATLSPTLTEEFLLSSSDLGLLAGSYFLGFSITQLPMGFWLDQYGPKKVELGFLGLAVLGCLAFAMAHSFEQLWAARVLTGVGLSACLMAPLTGYRRWLDVSIQMRANSWMLMTGSLGMLSSTLPVQWILPQYGWRVIFILLAIFLVMAMIAIAWIVPKWHQLEHQNKDQKDILYSKDIELILSTKGLTSYWHLFRHPDFLSIAPLGFIGYGGMLAMQTLWAGPWMRNISAYSSQDAATGLFAINLGMLVAFWAWGFFNPKLNALGWSPRKIIKAFYPLNLVVQGMFIFYPTLTGAWTWVLFTLCCSCVALSQVAVGMSYPSQIAGRALSAFNLVIFTGVFIFQWGFGASIDFWVNKHFDLTQSYQASMAVFCCCCITAYAFFFLRSGHNIRQIKGNAHE
jgi:MFS family permease